MKFKPQQKRRPVDGRAAIVDIDDDGHVVEFDRWRLKKITGTRVASILGMNPHSSPFKVACELAGLYPGDKANKYIDAGNILEPVLRSYLSKDCDAMLRAPLRVPDGKTIDVEEPVPKETCGYDHFHNEPVFGGMVDGYIRENGTRAAILEIKTSNDRGKWLDEDGGCTNVPMNYMLQASLYAQLSRLDRIVFLVGFLEEPDYDRPGQWVPTPENTCIVIKDRLDMTGYMEQCAAWYKELQSTQCTPEWSDSEDDQAVLRYLKAYDPEKSGHRSSLHERVCSEEDREHQDVGRQEDGQVPPLPRILLRGVEPERDHARHRCDRGAEPPDVGPRQEALPVVRELRQHHRRGDVADDLADQGSRCGRAPVQHIQDGVLDDVYRGHVAGEHEQEHECQDQSVVHLPQRLGAGEQHHDDRDDEGPAVVERPQDRQDADDEQSYHDGERPAVHVLLLLGQAGDVRVPDEEGHQGQDDRSDGRERKGDAHVSLEGGAVVGVDIDVVGASEGEDHASEVDADGLED